MAHVAFSEWESQQQKWFSRFSKISLHIFRARFTVIRKWYCKAAVVVISPWNYQDPSEQYPLTPPSQPTCVDAMDVLTSD
jgi:hypothetical protein